MIEAESGNIKNIRNNFEDEQNSNNSLLNSITYYNNSIINREDNEIDLIRSKINKFKKPLRTIYNLMQEKNYTNTGFGEKEFENLIKYLNLDNDIDENRRKYLFDKYDEDKDGRLTYDEFRKLCGY